MNTGGTKELLVAKNEDGEYKIPFIVTADAFHSEMVNYSDLVLPDTTYLERHDTISLLDRPISEAHAVCDAIRQPVLNPEYDTRPWQEVLVELAALLQLPAFVDSAGQRKYKNYRDFIVNWEKSPGIGFLAGWRGETGEEHLRGSPNPQQWERYIENECFFREELPPPMRYFRFANRRDYLQYAYKNGWTESTEPIIIEFTARPCAAFRWPVRVRAIYSRQKSDNDNACENTSAPCRFITNRWNRRALIKTNILLRHHPKANVHVSSWDSQNAWLRQIAAQKLYLHQSGDRRDLGH